jgi:hypothetical protein
LRIFSEVVGMKRKTIAMLLSFAVFAGGTFWVREHRAEARNSTYRRAITQLEAQTKPGDTLGYLSSHAAYLFYGRHFDRKVVYLPFDRTQSLSQWLEFAQSKQPKIIAVGRLIDEGDMPRTEIYQRLIQAEKQGKLVRISNPEADPRRETVLYRLKARK